MSPHSLHAPPEDGGLLAEPPLDQAAVVLARHAETLRAWDYDFQGRPASWLRPTVRSQVEAKAAEYLDAAGLDPSESFGGPESPLVVTGHQPELFHPGVWVKNFAAAAVARRAGARALNLVVDNDIPKAAAIKVPRPEGDALRVERVPFDDWGGEVPYEDLRVIDEDQFADFADRARATLGAAVADPVLDEFWPRAVGFKTVTDRQGLRFALARRAVEQRWGVRNAEVPLSTVCETEGFSWFAVHLLAELPRFQEVHNAALQSYRTLYRIRSKNHPVAALGRRDDWREAPFWVWRREAPRRRPLLARQTARTLQLRIDGEAEPFVDLPLAAGREGCCAVEALKSLPGMGIRLRTRALTTTMFARYLLGDLFVHGIGGAKYDELGDEVSARFFGTPPPSYLTLSMTLWLGLGVDPGALDRSRSLGRELRDLDWNPDRRLGATQAAEVAAAVEAKQRAIAGPVDTPARRRERFHEIRRCNDALRSLVRDQGEAVRAEQSNVARRVKRNVVARSREYAAVLHSRTHLRDALEAAIPGLGPAGGAAEKIARKATLPGAKRSTAP